ncbi:serine/threonine-protein kinase [Peribacillus frigoritolerans]|uniref:serine/threonine-protein kinase n=1 Tax=Peribacillus frigoritolerans TaxID=450367 RepID=UPI00387131ED
MNTINLEVLNSSFPELKIDSNTDKKEGGQKFVYKATLIENSKDVALKIIKANQNPERIIREVQAVSSLRSPYFPAIFSTGKRIIENEEFVFVIEEYIEGKDLRSRLINQDLDINESLKIGLGLLDAIIEIHEKNLVHRDIKPENIMVDNNYRILLLDFGIARHLDLQSLTQDSALFGPLTVGYGAPEQITNEKRSISFRTDLFAWGVLMYELISGSNPFIIGSKDSAEVLTKTLNYNPPLLDNCESLIAELVQWCMHKAVHRRPPNPYIVRDSLKEVC